MSNRGPCIWHKYFGEYGMDVCEHPDRTGFRDIYAGDCRGCKLRRTATEGLKPCPFCGESARVSNWHGTWAVRCTSCGAKVERFNIDEATDYWNRRVS